MSLLRQWWAQVLVIGFVLFALADIILKFTGNANYLPTVMMLGAFLVPTSFVAFFFQQETIFDRGAHGGSILPTLIMCALLGGLIGMFAAGTLEHITLKDFSPVSLAWVGPIEEFSKLIVPVALYVVVRNRFRSELDGLLFGVTAGMAFAALETMGYELATLVHSGGDLGILDGTILMRGLLSPAGHGAWTGLITATLWKERERTGKAFTPVVLAFFLMAACLHSFWDFAGSFGSLLVLVPSYIATSLISLGLLIWRLSEARRQAEAERVTASLL